MAENDIPFGKLAQQGPGSQGLGYWVFRALEGVCALDGRTWNKRSAEPEPFTLGTLGRARQFPRTAKTAN